MKPEKLYSVGTWLVAVGSLFTAATTFGMDVKLGQSIQIVRQNEIGVSAGQVDPNSYYKVMSAKLIENDTLVEVGLEQFFTPIDKHLQKGLLNQPRNATIVVENKSQLGDIAGIKTFKN